MKKLLQTLFLLLTTAVVVNAQSYRPLLDSINVWHYVGTPLMVRLQQPPTTANAPCTYPTYFYTYKMQYTVQDTVIDSLTYKIVREEADVNPMACDFGYVREDTAARKVYFLDNLGDPEILLYDFSLQVNDTFHIDFMFNSGNYSDGTYIVDSIVPFHMNAGTTRLFCLHNQLNQWAPMYWAEGVGCLLNAFYPCASNSFGAPFFSNCQAHSMSGDEFVSCFDHYQKVFYDSCAYSQAVQNGCMLVTDTCDYYDICGAIEENTSGIDLQVFPGPAHECMHVTVTTAQPATLSFSVYDINGRKMNLEIPAMNCGNGEQQITVDISALPPGQYLLKSSSQTGVSSTLFLVQ